MHNEAEDEMIEKLDHDSVLKLLKMLNVCYESVAEAIVETRKTGLVPVAIGLPHPEITIGGIPIIFEWEGKEISVYHEEKGRLN